MKRLFPIIIIVILVYAYSEKNSYSPETTASPVEQLVNTSLQQAYKNRQSNLQVQGEGTAIKLLADDIEGSRHQRFILKLSTGQTLLVAHNIDLADRINSLKRGDTVEFYGEYEWNSKGGVLHWTHHDPSGKHINGWLKHGGQTYQ